MFSRSVPRLESSEAVFAPRAMSHLQKALLRDDSQAKAQREIDEVVGRERLPTYDDRKYLPYIEAIYREVMRWHPPGPLGELLARLLRPFNLKNNFFRRGSYEHRGRCLQGLLHTERLGHPLNPMPMFAHILLTGSLVMGNIW